MQMTSLCFYLMLTVIFWHDSNVNTSVTGIIKNGLKATRFFTESAHPDVLGGQAGRCSDISLSHDHVCEFAVESLTSDDNPMRLFHPCIWSRQFSNYGEAKAHWLCTLVRERTKFSPFQSFCGEPNGDPDIQKSLNGDTSQSNWKNGTQNRNPISFKFACNVKFIVLCPSSRIILSVVCFSCYFHTGALASLEVKTIEKTKEPRSNRQLAN